MKFEKYNSLENHYKQAFLQKVLMEGLDSGMWVATEKVHGSNFSFWTDGIEIKTAKRSGFDEDFCGAVHLKAKYASEVFAMYNELVNLEVISYCEEVVFFGEVFGGSYHGQKGQHAKTVQKGMNYHPETEFILFDIKVIGQDGNENPISRWLSYDEMCELVGNTTMKAVPEIGHGTLQEMLELNNEFPTKVPDMFDLELPEGVTEHTIGEGLVIRPASGERFLRNGSRVIIKSKNSKFNERSGKAKTIKDLTLSEESAIIFKEFSLYFSRPRLEAVISKECSHDELNWKMIGKLSGLLMQDAMKDFNLDIEDNKSRVNYDLSPYEGYPTLKDLIDDEWKKFSKHSMNLAMDVVRQYFKETL